MMNDFNEFFNDNPWKEINTGSYPEGRRLYKHDERFWVSIDDNNKMLFFVHENDAENVKSLKNLAGVEVDIESFENGSCRLVCTLTDDDSDMKEKFSIVAKDVAYNCSSFSGTQLLVKVQERIKSWANFLKPKRDGLSYPQFVGFWGELYTVSDILMKAHSPSDAVRFWIGPEGKKQDITLNNIALEVKTSISGDSRTIKISSLEQLERITEKLYLLHLIANPSNNEQGMSLEDMYRKCLQAVSSDVNAETLFLHKTSELYGKANDIQLKEKFSIVSMCLYDVRDEFPCITGNNLNIGISSVKYEINITSIKRFEEITDIQEILQNG